MFKPTIGVNIEIYPGDFRYITFPLDEHIILEVFQSIDFPSDDALPVDGLLCTDQATIQRVMRSRKDIAKLISQKLTTALLDEMGAKDTKMGYPMTPETQP